ncbi:MAG: hypothetical protein HOJ48_11755, partial [Desulfobacula sp.]|nr:hypothetical protein [Desulfobacula sp.]
MIFDGHAHLFHPKVILNVKKRIKMVEKIGLKTKGVDNRIGVKPLEDALKKSGIDGCLILPTAGVHEVGKVNDLFYKTIEKSEFLYTAGTLHPGHLNNKKELEKFVSRNIKAIKLCSFSQKFVLNGPETFDLFDLIQEFNISQGASFFVVLDTLYGADLFFGSHPDHNTTPKLLGDLVKSFPAINFIAAHMGGLAAPFREISSNLTPADNLFFDTSNAAHVLEEKEFIYLLK